MDDEVKPKLSKKKRLISAGLVGIFTYLFIITMNWIFVDKSDPELFELIKEMYLVKDKVSVAVIDYKVNHRLDISDLDMPEGTLQAGFIENSPLFNKLGLSVSDFDDLKRLDMKDVIIKFVTDGKYGEFKLTIEVNYRERLGRTKAGSGDGYFEFDPYQSEGKFISYGETAIAKRYRDAHNNKP